MSKDMKLIMENWRRNTLNEAQFDTIGKVRKAIKAAIAAKKKEISKGKAKALGGEALMDMMPGSNIAKGLLGIARAMYRLPDKEKTGTALDHLNVDDMISIIVDDGVENKFLDSFLKKFEGLPDDVPLVNIDMTKSLIDFINDEYHRTISKPQRRN
tara:strand:+ start:4713 stop:5180 length:468 start_codon:yes stop_codon:yes gene_type:complete